MPGLHPLCSDLLRVSFMIEHTVIKIQYYNTLKVHSNSNWINKTFILRFLPPPILSSVGQDCYTRLWSLKDGHLLRTIPSPHPVANDLIPSVVFSSKLGGCRGLPGLLMAVKHDLYYFPYNTDYQEGGEQQQQAGD